LKFENGERTDLIDAEGELFVGQDVVSYDFGDFFFVGWGEEETGIFSIFDSEELV